MENSRTSSNSTNQEVIQTSVHNLFDDRLMKARKKAMNLCFKLNQTKPSKTKKRTKILNQLGIQMDNQATITSPFYCNYGYHIKLGKNFFCNHNCVMLDNAPIIIKDNVMIGPNVCLSTVNHPLDTLKRRQGEETTKSIIIEDDVWLSAGVIVLAGVRIGKESIIGAGSVVTKDIPPYSIAYGVPCVVKGSTKKNNDER